MLPKNCINGGANYYLPNTTGNKLELYVANLSVYVCIWGLAIAWRNIFWLLQDGGSSDKVQQLMYFVRARSDILFQSKIQALINLRVTKNVLPSYHLDDRGRCSKEDCSCYYKH